MVALPALVGVLGCSARERTPAPPAGRPAELSRDGTTQAGSSAGGTSPDGGKTEASAAETCLDAWLHKRNLDPYGNPEGTMYAGGTPLFDERTGETKERLDYVFERHPDARDACGRTAPQSGPAAPGKPTQ